MVKVISTVDGKIDVKVKYNSFFNEYQLDVDGVIMASSKDKDYIINEFNNI